MSASSHTAFIPHAAASESTIPSPPSFASGERIASRYLIRGLVGQGGMGQVFEAQDLELGMSVALKVLKPGTAANPASIAALRREVQLARQVTHRNVCRTFDLVHDEPIGGRSWGGRIGPQTFLTMEILRGPTLRERIRERSPLPLSQIADLARQLAAGLQAAHAVGIVHGDLKSSNVMLDQQAGRERLVITDFGLAQALGTSVAHDDPVCESGGGAFGRAAVAGTPGYIAPELVHGAPRSPSSDLFALGVVLYELTTASRPFHNKDAIGGALAAQAALPTPPAELRSDLPRPWSEAVLCCLDPQPERRFRSAREAVIPFSSDGLSSADRARSIVPVLADSTLPTGAGEGVPAPRREQRRRARELVAFLRPGLVAIALLGVAGLRGSPPPEMTGKADPRKEIVLGDLLATQNGDLAEALHHGLGIALEQSRSLRVLSGSQMDAALERMSLPAESLIDERVGVELGVREGAEAVVFSRLEEVGGRFQLSAWAVDPGTGETLFSVAEKAVAEKRLLAAVDRLARRLRRGLGESRRNVQENSAQLERVTTADLEALRWYSVGKRRLDDLLPEDAIPFFERAVDRDPGFAIAHAKLAAAYRMLDRRHADVLAHLQRALSAKDRLSPFEGAYVEAWVGSLVGSPDAVASWEMLSHRHPDRIIAHYNLGLAHALFALRFDAAAEAFSRAETMPAEPRVAATLEHLGYSRLALGRVGPALKSFEHATFGARHPTAAYGDGLAAVGRHEDAQEWLSEAIEHPSPRTRLAALFSLAGSLADEGRLREALVVTSRSTDLIEARSLGPAVAGSAELLRASLLERLGDREGLARSVGRLAELALQACDEPGRPLGSIPLLLIAAEGKVLARHGAVDTSRRLLHSVRRVADKVWFPSYKAAMAILEAEVEAASGSRDLARSFARQALELGSTFQARETMAFLETGDAKVEQLEWLVDHRSQAFGEVLIDDVFGAVNVLAWGDALGQLAALREARGQREEAAVLYRRVIDRWSAPGADHPGRQAALEGLGRVTR